MDRKKAKIGTDEMRRLEKERKRNYRENQKNSQKFRMLNGLNGRKEKKTKEQIKEDAKLRKQKQRQLMKNKYGDNTWKAIHAKEIAIVRARKLGNIENEKKLEKELLDLKNN